MRIGIVEDRVSPWPLNMSAEDRNLIETRDDCTTVDLMYVCRELEKRVLELEAAAEAVQVDEAGTEVPVDLSALSAQIASLSAQIALLPVGLTGSGPPAAGLGKNFDEYWDYVNRIAYKKRGGEWQQLAS